MKTRFLVVLTLLLFAAFDVSEAGWRGRWGGRGWHGGWGWRGGVVWRGPGWGWRGPGWGWRGPGWGWRGPGWWGWGPGIGVGIRAPGVGVGIVAPLPIYGGVYASRPVRPYVAYSGPTLYRAQVRLARLGYDPGPPDGVFGPMTSRALRDYQLDNGLPATGRLDNRTRASLGV
jgi:hypothetical protein